MLKISTNPDNRREHLLETALRVARPAADLFDFFSDAFQLETITPPFLNFRILTPAPIHIGEGTLIDYQLRLHRIPVRWQTRISRWEPPYGFVDEQIRGPFRRWHHEHTFHEHDGQTTVRDRVEYRVPGGSLVHRFFVRPDLEKIFRFRMEKLKLLLSPSTDHSESPTS